MKTAFVAGATGFTGREVVRALVSSGVSVVAHIRKGSSSLEEFKKEFEPQGVRVDTTPWESAALASTLAGIQPDAVFSLLGTTRSRAKAESKATGGKVSYETVDLALTVMLIGAAAGLQKKPAFVYLSAAGVSPKSSGAYYSARKQAEEKLLASGLPWIIARPSFITGEGRDRPLEHMGVTLVGIGLKAAGLVGARRLSDQYAETPVKGLASILAELAFRKGAENRVYEGPALRR